MGKVNDGTSFSLGDVRIKLAGRDRRIRHSYEALLALSHQPESHYRAELLVNLRVANRLPERPQRAPVYGSPPDITSANKQYSLLEVYRDGSGFALYFQDAAAIWAFEEEIHGVVTPTIWRVGRFSDVVYTSLAPLLRRKGIYLLHAAAVSYDGEGVLLVGPSGSGKSTTSLALALEGWRYLANDVVAITEAESGIMAMPTPDVIGVTDETLRLLPNLAGTFDSEDVGQGKRPLTGRSFVKHLGQSAPIRWIVFPQVSDAPGAYLRSLDGPLALARLIENSVDRWDDACLDVHIEVLARLCRQADTAELQLSPNLASVADALRSALSGT